MCPVKREGVSAEPAERRLILRADGASRGNPGPAAGAYLLLDEQGREVASEGRYLGSATNNEAEYRALIAGLERAVHLGVTDLEIRLDSELIVLQLLGRYRVKATNLRPLYERCRALLAGFPRVSYRHVPRHLNSRADALANRALDQALRSR